MIIEMNPNVQKVIEFMQRELPANELNGVAEAIPLIGRAIWTQHPHLPVTPAWATSYPEETSPQVEVSE